MAQWITLDDVEIEDYRDGYLVPLQVRETDHGIEVWMPHEFYRTYFAGNVVCSRCGLMPFHYDSIEVDCED